MEALTLLIHIVARAVTWLMIIYVVMGWLLQFNVLNYHNDVVRQIWNGVSRLADALCDPIRRLLPSMGGLDFSPMIVIIIAILLETFLIRDVLGAL